MLKLLNQKSIGTLTLFSLFMFLLLSRPALANEHITCNVLTVEASKSGKGLDEALKQYSSIFAQKPFDVFDTFKLVSQKKYVLELQKPMKLILPSELSGSLEYQGKTSNQLKLSLKLSKSQDSPIIIEGTAGNGVPFMAAGFKSPEGRWILAVQCVD